MTSMELEAYKAELACEILTTDSRQVLDEVKRLLTKLSKKKRRKNKKRRKSCRDRSGSERYKSKKDKTCYRITSRIAR